MRRYWKGDENLASEVGYRLTGSADLYPGRRAASRRRASTSSPRTTASRCTIWSRYGSKHNEANGEHNQDGADDNQSWNHGVEGETDDPEIIALRERQKRNLLATLLLSQGVPMLLGGDEMGRTQRGNNNAYCQDNELSWVDWNLDDRRRSAARVHAPADRAAPPAAGAAAAALLRRRLHLGVASRRTWPGCGPTATEMTPRRLAEALRSRRWRSLLGGDAIPHARRARPAAGRRRPAGAA